MFNFNDRHFKQRWDNAPPIVRQVFHNDLARIEQLLDLDTDFEQWQRHEEKASQQSHLLIEQTYLDIIQNLKLRKQNLLQLVLEKKLAQKRAEQVAQSQKLQQDELKQTLQETQTLQQLGIQIQQESGEYADRYHKTPPILSPYNTALNAQKESLRLRLELEAENIIQNMIQQYRQQLRQIARDEVEYLLSAEDDELIKEQKNIQPETENNQSLDNPKNVDVEKSENINDNDKSDNANNETKEVNPST